MYADDIVLMLTTAEGLQRLINATAQYCRGISQAKTAVVVFRSKSHKAAWEHTWTCDGDPLQQGDACKYLGLVFTATRGVAGGMLEMQRRQNAAAGLLRRCFKRLNCHYSIDVMMQLYLTTVASTASYGCEVWGLLHMVAECRTGRNKSFVELEPATYRR